MLGSLPRHQIIISRPRPCATPTAVSWLQATGQRQAHGRYCFCQGANVCLSRTGIRTAGCCLTGRTNTWLYLLPALRGTQQTEWNQEKAQTPCPQATFFAAFTIIRARDESGNACRRQQPAQHRLVTTPSDSSPGRAAGPAAP